MVRSSISIALVKKLLFIPLVLLFPIFTARAYGVHAIYLAEPISDLFAVIVAVIIYAITRKTLETTINNSETKRK